MIALDFYSLIQIMEKEFISRIDKLVNKIKKNSKVRLDII